MAHTQRREQVDGQVVPLSSQHVEERKTLTLGMVSFLASWAMLFAGLFFVLAMVRVRSPAWPPVGVEPLPMVLPSFNTLVIFLSSFTLHHFVQLRAAGQRERSIQFFWITLGLATVFLSLQLWSWISLWDTGFQLSSGLYAAYFYTFTVFHGLHALVGIGLLCWLMPHMRGASRPLRENQARMVAMFWHFVGGVWGLMFLLVYVL